MTICSVTSHRLTYKFVLSGLHYIFPSPKGEGLYDPVGDIYTDGWKAYDGLILNGYDHYRVHHSKDEFARGKCHVNGIESFWSFAKRHLAKFNGIASHKFLLHLKESEFRFNYRNTNLYDKMLVIVGKF